MTKRLSAFAIIFFLLPQTCLGESAQELAAAAVRLKQAHVVRSYEKCIVGSNSDADCRRALEELHPREVAALANLAGLADTVDEYVLSASFAACYDPTNDYLDLIECWENLARELESSSSTSTSSIAVTQPEKPVLEDLEWHIVQQLSCLERPEPIFTLLALERLGKIKRTEMVGYDSISCFRIHEGIQVKGLTFVSVCGHSEDRLVRELFPGLMWRGPGTSPGQFISFGTNVNFETASQWYMKNLFFRRFLNQAIKTENTYMGDATEVTCSSWMRN